MGDPSELTDCALLLLCSEGWGGKKPTSREISRDYGVRMRLVLRAEEELQDDGATEAARRWQVGAYLPPPDLPIASTSVACHEMSS